MCSFYDRALNFFSYLFGYQIQPEQANKDNKNQDLLNFRWSVKRVLDNEMLSDNEIYESLLILRKQFVFKRYLKGFQDPMTFSARFLKNPSPIVTDFTTDKFVQILHDGAAHWITVTNFGTCQRNHVRVFDSLYREGTYENNLMLESFFRRLYRIDSNQSTRNDVIVLDSFGPIKCTIESVQIQSDRALCGLFAIAFAVDLCHERHDPSNQFYNEEKLRKHLFQSLRAENFSEFPKLEENSVNVCRRSRTRNFDILI